MNNHRRLTHVLLLVMGALTLGACVTAPTQPAVRLYVFDGGTIETTDVSVFHPGVGKDQFKRLTNSCYLITHPRGTLIWDTGLPDALVDKPEGMKFYETFTFRVTRPLAAQLKEIGVDPARIDYLGISHMHGDHVGNATLFPRATLLMQQEEHAAAFGPNPGQYGFNPGWYPSLAENPVRKLAGDHDVFGDGSVVIKRALGHTPGHQALFVRLPRTGNVLLSGDLVHFTDNWVHKRVPGFNFDKDQSAKTLHETEQFLKANRATLWIQHDLEQNATIRHAPAYYE